MSSLCDNSSNRLLSGLKSSHLIRTSCRVKVLSHMFGCAPNTKLAPVLHHTISDVLHAPWWYDKEGVYSNEEGQWHHVEGHANTECPKWQDFCFLGEAVSFLLVATSYRIFAWWGSQDCKDPYWPTTAQCDKDCQREVCGRWVLKSLIWSHNHISALAHIVSRRLLYNWVTVGDKNCFTRRWIV